jgi:hypothetical protein
VGRAGDLFEVTQRGFDLAVVVVGFDGESRGERGQSLGDRAMSTAAKEEYAHHDAHD